MITRTLLALIFCFSLQAAEHLPHLSTVAKNGMPKNIVKVGARWNFGPGSLWTHRGWQYAAYWDDACQVSVARRELPTGAWSTISLPGYQRTESTNRGKAGPKARGFGDGHEKVVMGISPDGIIHLAFDHHVSTLHYRTSKKDVANNPTKHKWTPGLFGPVQDSLGAEKIASVTYPRFTTDGTHFSLYLRLNGGSGNADSHFFHYLDGQWTTPDPASAKVIDKNWSGGNKTVNAYPHGLAIQNGRRHLTWCWRDTPDPKTCHDLCYAYSDDHGKTWLNNSSQLIGRSGEKFITADSPGVAARKLGPDSRFINGGSMTVDQKGRVHVLVRGEDGSPTYFGRDPKTGTWKSKKTNMLAKLVPGPDDKLYLISEDGIWRTSAKDFDKLEPVHTSDSKLFESSKIAVDRHRAAHDGWISVIGQRGKTITVIDYWIGK